jgi:hypothetical protein
MDARNGRKTKVGKRAAISSARRENLSMQASVYRGRVFATGAFKRVYAGVYTEGPRVGEACVAKEFIDRDAYEAEFFASELAVVREAMIIIGKFNHEMGYGDAWKFYLNSPAVWEYEHVGSETDGIKTLVEPMIDGCKSLGCGWCKSWCSLFVVVGASLGALCLLFLSCTLNNLSSPRIPP